MTGVRLDRFLASTALVLVLSAGGGALAGPAEQPDAAQVAPAAATVNGAGGRQRRAGRKDGRRRRRSDRSRDAPGRHR